MAKAPSRVLRIALILSLALNLVLVGIFAGAAFRLRDGGPPQRVDFSLGPLGRALEPEDRRAIARALRSEGALRESGPRTWRTGLEDMATIIAADPFDPEALSAHLAAVRGRGAALIEAGQTATVDRIAAMSAEDRAALAERVLAEGLPRGRKDRDRDAPAD